MRALVVLALLAGCADVAATVTPQPDDYVSVAEAYCKAHPELPCGHVYECDAAADNALGHIEICVAQQQSLTAAEAVYGACAPTPRHEGLCWWCCGAGCGGGCNAYSGCFCP